jgi:hypothetical protein
MRSLQEFLDATKVETALKVRREVEEDIPKNYTEALRGEDSTQWQESCRVQKPSLPWDLGAG